ncbi:MAG: DUF3006 domain-containing protein [Ruminococcus sp.]|nr:DUF3006 domain-containing protein [Ruminococcus sp.]
MKKFTVDRIEEGKAVLECENGDMVNLDLSALPKNVRKRLKDGDVLNFEENSCFLNKEETMARKQRIEKLMSEVFED